MSARCTSAAPTYFKKYVHHATNRTFIDGGIGFNNPIEVYNWERMLVWAREPDELEDCKIPDIMLSIGAGVQNKAFRSSTGLSRLTTVLPSGVKDRVAALHQTSKAALECEQVFANFCWNLDDQPEFQSRCQRLNLDDQPEFQSRCQRLNIVLDDQPCRLDDVQKLEELDNIAKEFLKPDCRIQYDSNYRNAYSHIEAVASRIRASLFYFDITSVQQESPAQGRRWEIEGQLRCRLKRQYLNEFLALLRGNPSAPCRFRARVDTHVNADITHWSFDPADWDTAKFSIGALFKTIDRKSPMIVEMSFGSSGKWEMISGFPRFIKASPHDGDVYTVLTEA